MPAEQFKNATTTMLWQRFLIVLGARLFVVIGQNTLTIDLRSVSVNLFRQLINASETGIRFVLALHRIEISQE